MHIYKDSAIENFKTATNKWGFKLLSEHEHVTSL